MPPPLCNDERRELLALARAAITESILHNRISDFPAPCGRLAEPGAAFVTLFRRGQLRGCVGLTGRDLSLAEAVVQSAISAAHNDPRFPAIAAGELPEMEIEISVLSEPLPTSPGEIEAGVHGLLVVRGKNRGLLLPQVAVKHSWSAERFLEETCRKAGLATDEWRHPETQVWAFRAEVFSEKDLDPAALGQTERRYKQETREGSESKA
jgi:AmmeMemoRadiSam system protein A